MDPNTYVGLDVHRKSIVATALDDRGEPLAQTKLGPSRTELADFLRTLPGRKHVVMEPCTIWEPIYEALEKGWSLGGNGNPGRVPIHPRR